MVRSFGALPMGMMLCSWRSASLELMTGWVLGQPNPKGMPRKSSNPCCGCLSNLCSLWSRLILHFWALEAEKSCESARADYEPDPVGYLQRAYEQTIAATSSPTEWLGTTTACAALLHCPPASSHPVIYVTNLGDSQVLVIRPRVQKVLYKTTEQWHWFDCPRQLGTNSPDTPVENAVVDKVDIEENDVILAMSDGVIDNLWEHEVVQNVLDNLQKWDSGQAGQVEDGVGGMDFVAKELVKAARVIAEDPFAESPFMERAVEEGLAMEGGM